MNERLELLVQLEVDGEISDSERTELDAATASDPATREYRTRMLELAQDLDALAWHEPSPELGRRILDELGIATPARRAPAPRHRWRLEFRQAVAFAAGIAVMLVAGRFLPAVDGDLATGTLIAPGPATELERGVTTFGDTSIEAWTERSGDRLFLRARGTGDATAPVRIEWEDPDWSFVSVRSVPPAILGVDRGRARIAWTGSGPFTLELELQAGHDGAGEGDVRLLPDDPSQAGSPLTLDAGH